MPLTARVPRHTRPCHKATLATMVPARSLMLVSLLPLPPRLPRAPRQAMPLRHHRHHHHLTTQPKPPHRSLHGLGSTALYRIHSTCKAWRYEHCFLSRDLVRGTRMLLFVVPICVCLCLTDVARLAWPSEPNKHSICQLQGIDRILAAMHVKVPGSHVFGIRALANLALATGSCSVSSLHVFPCSLGRTRSKIACEYTADTRSMRRERPILLSRTRRRAADSRPYAEPRERQGGADLWQLGARQLLAQQLYVCLPAWQPFAAFVLSTLLRSLTHCNSR